MNEGYVDDNRLLVDEYHGSAAGNKFAGGKKPREV